MRNCLCCWWALLMILLFPAWGFSQKNISLQSQKTYSTALNDIWGYTDTAGNEYALVGLNNGVSVVDISTPTSPVEVARTKGPTTTWRDIKTWDKHAYVINEADSGLLIIDLSHLPDSVTTRRWSEHGYTTAHNIFIDENGYGYVMGANDTLSKAGALILNLSNPKNPAKVGSYTQAYVHDGYVRGDTMLTGEIYKGWFAVVDISNKSNPQVLANHSTPHNYTHNIWPSSDGTHVFTTDEKSDAFVASYNVEDLDNIKEVDRYRSSHSDGSIPHNTFNHNDFLVTSYYADGITIVDAHRPSLLVEVGYYDTSPSYSGDVFKGCWGVYPYLPSGNIIASDRQEGLYVLKPDYQRACYLQGTVIDSLAGDTLSQVEVRLPARNDTVVTNSTGYYQMGVPDSGKYKVEFAHKGYQDRTVEVLLDNGNTTVKNVQLLPNPFNDTGQVVNATTNNGIAQASVIAYNADSTFYTSTDTTGRFVIDSIYADTFSVIAGKWSFISGGKENIKVDGKNNEQTLRLSRGIYDDFTFDFNWDTFATATEGQWIRANPDSTARNDTLFNPGNDVSTDFYNKAFVTGNKKGAAPAENDVDSGFAHLISPSFDMQGQDAINIRFYSWFQKAQQSEDAMSVYIYNDQDTILLDRYVNGVSQWQQQYYQITKNELSFTDSLRLHFTISDTGQQEVVEGGIDALRVKGTTINKGGHPDSNLSVLDQKNYSPSLNDIWGYTDSSGNKYAIVGLKTGVSIVDITDSTQIQEVAFIKGPSSIWRDIKTWQHYAYVINEKDSGALIIDLSGLPGDISYKRCGTFTAHNLFIDEKGYAYIFGYNGTGGALIADLAADPMNPPMVGQYNENYVHDGYVRGDTLWTAEINAGQFAAIDVSDKSSPEVLATHSTPHAYAHNVWLSDNGKYLFTTDEKEGAYFTAYDVSDLNNIQEVDRYQTQRNTQVIPHNVLEKDKFLINSYYTEGVTVVDALYPGHLVEVGHFDTSPAYSGGGFNGCWGVYPFENSNIIVASDIEEGLYVLSSNYTRAARLQGTITDSATLTGVDSVKVELQDTVLQKTWATAYTNEQGEFQLGLIDSGYFNVRLSGAGCDTSVNKKVYLQQGSITVLADTLVGCQTNKRQRTVENAVSNPESSLLHGVLPIETSSPRAVTNITSRRRLCQVTGRTDKKEKSTRNRLWANPSVFTYQTQIHLKVGALQAPQGHKLIIYNKRGQTVREINLSTVPQIVEIGPSLSTGLYFVNWRTPSFQKTIKIVKIKSP